MFWVLEQGGGNILHDRCTTCIIKGYVCGKSFARRVCNPCEVSRSTCSLKADLSNFWRAKGISFVTHRADQDVELGK